MKVAKRMPASQFRAWLKRMGYTQDMASRALGATRTSVRRWSGSAAIGKGSKGAPPHIALACEALEARKGAGQ